MKHLFLWVWVYPAVMLLLSGCISNREIIQKNGSGTGRLIGQRLLESIREKNYAQFSGILSEYGAVSVSGEEFLRSDREFSRQFGMIVSFRYLTELETPAVRNLLWVVTLERQSALLQKPAIRQELLFRLVIAENRKEGKVRILGIGFF